MSERAPQTESELIELVRAIDVRAPQDLHERIEALVTERAAPSGGDARAAGATAAPSWLPRRLGAAATAVVIPNWEARYGWRSAGERIGRVGARAVTTVFYEAYGGRSIGYAIVAGTPAPSIGGGAVSRVDGTSYRVSPVGGGNMVTWLRDGRLCVIGGRVSAGTLLALASSS